MNVKAVEIIKDVIINWKSKKNYTYHVKDFVVGKSPVDKEEFIFRFFSTLPNFNCNGEIITVKLDSKIFHSTTIGNSSISDNPEADKFRLENFLQKFNEEFDELVQEKLNDCNDLLFDSDLGFF